MKYHPSHELLTAFASAELPASLSIAISAHLELCPQCQNHVDALSKHNAEQIFAHDSEKHHELVSEQDIDDMMFDEIIDDMVNDITVDDTLFEVQEMSPIEVEFKGQHYSLPRALQSLTLQKPQKLGKLTRSRIDLQDGQLKTSLLHIEPGGSVPMHTHKGFELTLLLSGEFSDSMGHYQAGDFIWLTGDHEHAPSTETGCLCLTVSSDALQFTQGISKILNPIGPFIY